MRIKSIDYLRGLSIIGVILIHILAWHNKSIDRVLIWHDAVALSEYTKIPLLFNLGDFLHFFVVALVFCSGFSLYLSNHTSLKWKDLKSFYIKRAQRLVYPWWTFLSFFFSFHFVYFFITGVRLIDLSWRYILSSYLLLGGMGFAWIIFLMLILMLMYPFLRYLFDKYNHFKLFGIIILIYSASVIIFNFNPLNVYNLKTATTLIGLIFFLTTSILGWGVIYMIGFLAAYLHNHPSKKEIHLALGIGVTSLFIIIFKVYQELDLSSILYDNKYPPSPYYLLFGLMMTLVLFIYFSYMKHRNLKKILSFFSKNSLWAFMWNALTLTILTPILADFTFTSIYRKLVWNIILNFIFVVLLVILHNKVKTYIRNRKTQNQ